MFTLTQEEMVNIKKEYLAKLPDTLTSQFKDRVSKEQAASRHGLRMEMASTLYPSGW